MIISAFTDDNRLGVELSMETKVYMPTPTNIRHCAALLKRGDIVAFPTETVYGLGADARNETAVRKIYEAKGRPADNPLIVHVADAAQIKEIAADIPAVAVKLTESFSPGPLTVVYRKKSIIPDIVTGGLQTVGIRIPAHPVALDLLRDAGVPVCAPSANLSTKPSPTTAKHVMEDMDGRIPAVLDGGACRVGIESTVIDVTTDPPRILRKGGIPVEEIVRVIGNVGVVRSDSTALCPGMKYKHYAPKAEVLFSAYYDDMHSTICEYYDKLKTSGKNPVILALAPRAKLYGSRAVMTVGADYRAYAHNLFADLRLADEKGYTVVIAEGVEPKGIGESLINRLIKSSGGQII